MHSKTLFFSTLALPFLLRLFFQLVEHVKIQYYNDGAKKNMYPELPQKDILKNIFNSSLEFILTLTGIIAGWSDVSKNFSDYIAIITISIIGSICVEFISNENKKLLVNLLIILTSGVFVYLKTFPISEQGDKKETVINDPYAMLNSVESDTLTSNIKALCFDIIKGKKVDIETFKTEANKIKDKELKGLITAYFFMKKSKENCKKALSFVTSDTYKTDKNYILAKLEPSNDSLYKIPLLSGNSWVGIESDSIKAINEKITRSQNAPIKVKIFDCSEGYKRIATGEIAERYKKDLIRFGVSKDNIETESPSFDKILDVTILKKWGAGHNVNTRYYLNSNSLRFEQTRKFFTDKGLIQYDKVGQKIKDLAVDYDCIIVIGK